eukprot:364983-Chlamydomonas_euryale.AAC.2
MCVKWGHVYERRAGGEHVHVPRCVRGLCNGVSALCVGSMTQPVNATSRRRADQGVMPCADQSAIRQCSPATSAASVPRAPPRTLYPPCFPPSGDAPAGGGGALRGAVPQQHQHCSAVGGRKAVGGWRRRCATSARVDVPGLITSAARVDVPGQITSAAGALHLLPPLLAANAPLLSFVCTTAAVRPTVTLLLFDRQSRCCCPTDSHAVAAALAACLCCSCFQLPVKLLLPWGFSVCCLPPAELPPPTRVSQADAVAVGCRWMRARVSRDALAHDGCESVSRMTPSHTMLSHLAR